MVLVLPASFRKSIMADIGMMSGKGNIRIISQNSPVVPSFSKDSSVGHVVGSSFGVSDGYVKCIVGPRSTYLNTQNVYCWIHVGDFV